MGLALETAVDADDAPRHVVVDRRALAGEPDQRDDGQPAAVGHVQDVLAVAVAAADLVLRGEPAVLAQQRREPPRDRGRIADQADGVADEVGEGGGGHSPKTSQGARRIPGFAAIDSARRCARRPAETNAEKLAQLQELRDAAVHHASATAVEKQHAKGKYTARERIEKLLDPGSFQELDTYVRHRTHEFEMDKSRPWGDAVVTGHGTIEGRRVCVFCRTSPCSAARSAR